MKRLCIAGGGGCDCQKYGFVVGGCGWATVEVGELVLAGDGGGCSALWVGVVKEMKGLGGGYFTLYLIQFVCGGGGYFQFFFKFLNFDDVDFVKNMLVCYVG